MKRLISILIMSLMTIASQNVAAQSGLEYSTQPMSMKQRVVRHVPKVKFFRSNPYRFNRIYIDDQDEVAIDDEDLMSPYRREHLFKVVHVDGISDNAKWRLFLIRQLALLKHRSG